MARENFVPIKVILKRKPGGNLVDWPDFNRISEHIRQGMKWSHYIDVIGISWHYNKVENLGTGADNGEACSCVPLDFAEEAVKLFPDRVSTMTELEFQDFYDNKAHAHEPDEHMDLEILKGIQLKKSLGIALTTNQEKAIDPNTEVRGIRKNKQKKWSDAKPNFKIKIHKDYIK